jgi:hypothetical protein
MKFYALMETTIDEQTYKIGDQVELRNETDEDKRDIERYTEWGILSKTPPKASKGDSETSESQRTRRTSSKD